MSAKFKSIHIVIMSLGVLGLISLPSASRAEYLLYVPSTQACPKYSKRVDDNHCKPFVSNRIIGASFSGRCPAGSSNIGSGYCMYGPEKPAIFSTPIYR